MRAYLTSNEIQLMEKATRCKRDQLIVRLLFRLGCRVSEALNIKVGDIDFEKAPEPEKHCTLAPEILRGKVDEEIIRAVKAHNFDHLDVQPKSKMEYCLIAADAISGLIIAAALILPSKKLRDVKVESIGKRFKEKDFARRCSRERILVCERIGIPKEKFFEIALEAMQGISEELGL